MKLIATIGEDQTQIEIFRNDHQVLAEIEGRKYVLEASEPEPNVFLLRYANRVYEVYVSPLEPFSATVKGREFEFGLSDPKSLRGRASSSGANQGATEIKTAMPGKVVRILAETESEVREGQAIIVVEAMKMQNEMKSPKDGVLKEIRFAEGETVDAGDVLAIIE